MYHPTPKIFSNFSADNLLPLPLKRISHEEFPQASTTYSHLSEPRHPVFLPVAKVYLCVYCQNFHFCITSQPLSPLQGHCFSNSLSLYHQFYSLCWIIPISMHTYCYGSGFKENPSLDPIPLQVLSHFSASFYGNTQNNFLYPVSLIKFLFFFLVLTPTRLSLLSFY